MITITDRAALRIKEILQNEDKEALRVFVHGGGCSGFQYGLAVLNSGDLGINDAVIVCNEIRVVIDPISISYLKGCTIDINNEMVGGSFQITNPNAKSTCGCGQSFEPKN